MQSGKGRFSNQIEFLQGWKAWVDFWTQIFSKQSKDGFQVSAAMDKLSECIEKWNDYLIHTETIAKPTGTIYGSYHQDAINFLELISDYFDIKNGDLPRKINEANKKLLKEFIQSIFAAQQKFPESQGIGRALRANELGKMHAEFLNEFKLNEKLEKEQEEQRRQRERRERREIREISRLMTQTARHEGENIASSEQPQTRQSIEGHISTIYILEELEVLPKLDESLTGALVWIKEKASYDDWVNDTNTGSYDHFVRERYTNVFKRTPNQRMVEVFTYLRMAAAVTQWTSQITELYKGMATSTGADELLPASVELLNATGITITDAMCQNIQTLSRFCSQIQATEMNYASTNIEAAMLFSKSPKDHHNEDAYEQESIALKKIIQKVIINDELSNLAKSQLLRSVEKAQRSYSDSKRKNHLHHFENLIDEIKKSRTYSDALLAVENAYLKEKSHYQRGRAFSNFFTKPFSFMNFSNKLNQKNTSSFLFPKLLGNILHNQYANSNFVKHNGKIQQDVTKLTDEYLTLPSAKNK